MKDEETRLKEIEATLAVLLSDVDRLAGMVTSLAVDIAYLTAEVSKHEKV